MSTPYGDAALALHIRGWEPFPLPARAKQPPPAGFTGAGAKHIHRGHVDDWLKSNGDGNIGIHLAPNIIGIDVDAYGTKPGAATLTRLEREHGNLPKTVKITSRDDPISGIRLYRLPDGAWEENSRTGWEGIEIIRWSHRYVTAPPSIHPETGQTYRYVDEKTGELLDTLPPKTRIPWLPHAWCDAIKKENRPDVQLRAPIVTPTITNLTSHTLPNEPCQAVDRALSDILRNLNGGTSRHDQATAGASRLIRLEEMGHAGIPYALNAIATTFTQAIQDRVSAREAHYEWDQIVKSGRDKVALSDTPLADRGCCGPYANSEHATVNMNVDTKPTTPNNDATDDTTIEQEWFTRQVNRRVTELNISDRAKELVATQKAGQAPPLGGISLLNFLAQPDVEEQYRVSQLWPAEGRVLLPAPAKAGKTTLIVGNLIPALVDGGQFLQRFDTTAVTGRVIYFNMEVGERTLRRWLARSGVTGTDKVTVVNLRGQVAALGLATPSGRARLAQFLKNHEAEVVILDPLAPVLATLSLDEDKNSDVALFFSWWSEALAQAGVKDDLITHHTGHAGERSRGASRLLDEPDAIWTLTRDKSESSDDDNPDPAEMRYLQAYGRDVELAESGLAFDPTTGKLHILNGGKKIQRAATSNKNARAIALAYITENPGQLNGQIKEGMKGVRSDTAGHALASLVDAAVVRLEVGGGRGNPKRYYLADPA